MTDFALYGNVIYSENKDKLNITKNGYTVCVDGKCAGVFQELPDKYKNIEILDYKNKIIIPGFTDLHVHAPQYGFRSVSMDCELLEWLNKNVFPVEAKFADIDYAQKAYELFADDLKSGYTTRACIFGTLHTDATILLMELLEKSGLITMVGKVNMDRNSPDYLCEKSVEESLKETERFIALSGKFKNTVPIVTPRFIPSCTDKLMAGLSEIMKKYNLPVQSHLSENLSEIELVKKLCPESTSYGNAYESFGMMNDRTVMAHCVNMTDEEINLIKNNGVFVAHCPESNLNLASGISPVSKMLSLGINIGMGSDVSGGTSLSILKSMALAIQCSKMYWRYIDKKCAPLTVENVFYIATKGGGKFFGKAGSFEEGYSFDAVVIDDKSIKTQIDYKPKERIERIIYLGGKENIVSKYVAGNRII